MGSNGYLTYYQTLIAWCHESGTSYRAYPTFLLVGEVQGGAAPICFPLCISLPLQDRAAGEDGVSLIYIILPFLTNLSFWVQWCLGWTNKQFFWSPLCASYVQGGVLLLLQRKKKEEKNLLSSLFFDAQT